MSIEFPHKYVRLMRLSILNKAIKLCLPKSLLDISFQLVLPREFENIHYLYLGGFIRI